jgi:signal transduction histidine kinase
MEASTQLGKIIDDVLDMASFESGHVNVNCEVLDCLEVMAEVSRTLEVSARKRGILFTVDTSVNLPFDRRRPRAPDSGSVEPWQQRDQIQCGAVGVADRASL